jgi:hypothetical protein
VYYQSPTQSHTHTTHSLWNYNPDNDDVRGDNWNGENFSWFSRARAECSASLAQTDARLDAGARILRAVVRPYAAKLAGVPLRSAFEANTGRFELDWANPKRASKVRDDPLTTLPAREAPSPPSEISTRRSLRTDAG